jgi:hypothetical protein
VALSARLATASTNRDIRGLRREHREPVRGEPRPEDGTHALMGPNGCTVERVNADQPLPLAGQPVSVTPARRARATR